VRVLLVTPYHAPAYHFGWPEPELGLQRRALGVGRHLNVPRSAPVDEHRPQGLRPEVFEPLEQVARVGHRHGRLPQRHPHLEAVAAPAR
jgi:hypothetical protein